MLDSRWSIFIVVVLLFLCAIGFFYFKSDTFNLKNALPANVVSFGDFATVREKDPETPDDLVVVGDIMLARYVAEQMSKHGSDWPFRNTYDLLNAGTVLGNFEAAIPTDYEPTPDYGMTLSVSTFDLAGLVASGVTHLSLANNHSYDDGQGGYENTLKQLGLRGFVVSGDPNLISTSSIDYVQLGDLQLAIININDTYHHPEDSEWLPVVSEAVRHSDLQMVYVHWGEEYELVHNDDQEKFAHALIDAGVDLIVGTHPHVVQDIEKYKNKLIFYSLGNFIFDQYFSDDVQKGLAIRVESIERQLKVTLIPVETMSVPTQPIIMMGDDRLSFLADLADRSQPSLVSEIATGTVSLQF